MLSPPAGPALPGGYDFARAAWFEGSAPWATRWCAPSRTRPCEAPLGMRLGVAIERLRAGDRRAHHRRAARAAGAIADALITGERGGISDATNDAFRDFGLLHILSISGLHMVIMAGAVFLLVRFALAAVPAIALRHPDQEVGGGRGDARRRSPIS